MSIIATFLIAKDEAVIEEEIKDHDDCGCKDKGTGSEDELVGKRQMHERGNIESEFIERGE